jgi:hypothetical protein
MAERTTVRLPDELLARAKRKAAAEGRTLTALIEEGLRRVVNERPTTERSERKPLPVSTATGGVRPGIDIDNLARAAQELEDQEYVERFFKK